MNNSFNLNIDSYSLKELQKLFSLKNNFNVKQVQGSRDKLVNQLEKNKNLGAEKRQDILFFLDTASDRLKNSISSSANDTKTGTWSENIVPTHQYGSNFIITDPNRIAGKKANIVDGRIAVTGEAPPGYINPINVRTLMQPMSIDSRFRPNYYNTSSANFSVILPETQRKVVSMRIASIELPMTYYAFTNSFGNTTFLVVADSSGIALDGNPWKTTSRTYMNEKGIELNGFDPVVPAWLVTLPEGNYENRFLDKTSAFAIDTAVNDALSLAKPGALNSGDYFGFEQSPGIGNSIGYLNQGVPLGSDVTDSSFADLRYIVDHISGKSIFASPSYNSSVISSETGGTPFLPTSNINRKGIVSIRFNIGLYGDIDMNSNIQLKLGWQLGFRAAEYIMGQGAYEDASGHYHIPPNVPVSAVSEGVCFPVGPRYAFLSIDDHNNSNGPSFLVAYSNSTLDDNIITRINLSPVMDQTGVYKDSDDPGVSTQLNRTREYFGPVNIQRLEIKLYDEYGRILDLNNMDWSFTIAFEKLYD